MVFKLESFVTYLNCHPCLKDVVYTQLKSFQCKVWSRVRFIIRSWFVKQSYSYNPDHVKRLKNYLSLSVYAWYNLYASIFAEQVLFCQLPALRYTIGLSLSEDKLLCTHTSYRVKRINYTYNNLHYHVRSLLLWFQEPIVSQVGSHSSPRKRKLYFRLQGSAIVIVMIYF